MARTLGLVFFGPVLALPMRFWAALEGRFCPPWLRRLLAALAAYAGVTGILVTLGQALGGPAARVAATWQRWSPWHAVAKELFFRLAHAGIDTTTVACLELATCWATVALSCTLLLAPLYLWLLNRRR